MSRLSVRLSLAESGVRVQASDFKARTSQVMEETVQSLQSIWTEAGYEEMECQGLLGDILTKFKALCAAELAAEQQILEHAKNQVLRKMEDYEQLCAKLGRPAPEDDSGMGDNYADKLSRLDVCISDIEVEVSQRQEILDQRRCDVMTLAEELGEEVHSDFDGGDQFCELADDRLRLMDSYIEGLQNIRSKRVVEIRAAMSECAKCMQDLVVTQDGADTLPDHESVAEVDNAVLNHIKSGAFVHGVHKDFLRRLCARVESLCLEKEARREELARNGAEIARMWTLLRVSAEDRESFQKSFEMNLSMATLAKGRDELNRLRALRLQSMATVIASLREEIDSYWAELGVQDDSLKHLEFPLFFADVEAMEDNAIEEHEAFCETLRAKIEQLRPILAKIAKRESVVEERIELEHLMQNPERLTARGPKAREDRKREEDMQRRVKSLEKTTKELLTQISKWEESNDSTPFVYAGHRYADRVTEQEEAYIEIRDSLRNQRKKKDGKVDTASLKTVKKFVSSTAPSSLHHGSSTAEKVRPAKENSSNNLSSSLTSGLGASAKKSASHRAVPTATATPSASRLQQQQLEHPPAGSTPALKSAAVAVPLTQRDRTSSSSDFSDVTECTGVTEVREEIRASSSTMARGE